jgi:hypothetical protein
MTVLSTVAPRLPNGSVGSSPRATCDQTSHTSHHRLFDLARSRWGGSRVGSEQRVCGRCGRSSMIPSVGQPFQARSTDLSRPCRPGPPVPIGNGHRRGHRARIAAVIARSSRTLNQRPSTTASQSQGDWLAGRVLLKEPTRSHACGLQSECAPGGRYGALLLNLGAGGLEGRLELVGVFLRDLLLDGLAASVDDSRHLLRTR